MKIKRRLHLTLPVAVIVPVALLDGEEAHVVHRPPARRAHRHLQQTRNQAKKVFSAVDTSIISAPACTGIMTAPTMLLMASNNLDCQK